MGCLLSRFSKAKRSAGEGGCSANPSTQHKRNKDQANIVICSNSGEDSVQGLIQHIDENMPDVVQPARVRFEPLPLILKDMKKFKLKGIDALILCHSIDIKGPLRSCDGPNSIYHKLLHKAKDCLGKKKVAVIVHDFNHQQNALESLSNTLKPTFNMTSLVLALGKLAAGNPVQLTERQLDEFESFFRGALSYRRKIVGALYRFFYRISRR